MPKSQDLIGDYGTGWAKREDNKTRGDADAG